MTRRRQSMGVCVCAGEEEGGGVWVGGLHKML